MKKYLYAILWLLGTAIGFSQVKVEGIVTDSLQNPLVLANVVAINQNTKMLDSYGMTSDKGAYRLDLKPNTNYTLQISYIGMKPLETFLAIKNTDLTQNFILAADNQLDEVELVYEMPVQVKGDTLIYNADSFSNKTDRKLGDVLNKLPGVEVNDDGEIQVDGITVRKVMVEGKDFFDGDSKLATQNIPSNALDKIEVLKNYDEVNQLRNVRNNDESIAINIRLKEGKKNFWFGEVTAGAGLDERFLAHPKLFYYSPKYSLNLITDLNNIGQVPFTRRDYFKFTGGFRGANRDSGTDFNVESTDIGFLTLQNNRAQSIDAKFAAGNFNYSPTKTWDLSGFAIYSGNKTIISQESSKIYTEGFDQPDENTESNTTQKSDLGLFKISSKYIPNSNNHLDIDLFAKVSKQTENNDFYSSVLQNIDENQSQNPFTLNQNLNYYYTLNPKNIFAVEVQNLIQDEDPFYQAILESNNNTFKFADLLGLNNQQNYYNLNQEKRVKTTKLDAKADYWYVLNDKSNINLTLGGMTSTQRFNSEIYQILDNGDSNTIEQEIDGSTTKNEVTYHLKDAYAGFLYTLKTGIFTFRPGFSVHLYDTQNLQLDSKHQETFFRILPSFNTLIQLKKSETITINYSMKNTFTDVNQLAEGFVFNNYNSLFSGNRELENSLTHNASLRFFSMNMFNYTNIFATLSYSKRVNQIRNKINPISGSTNQTASPFNSNFDDESISLNGRLEKTLWDIKGSVGANVSYSKFNQFVQNRVNVNESFTQTYNTKFNTNFDKAPNFEAGYSVKINQYNQGTGNTTFYTHSPFVNMDAYFLNSFLFTADYTYSNYQNQDKTLNKYNFLDASLSYQKEDSKWEYKLSATNLLNNKSLNTDNLNNTFASTSEYFVQPRYVIFSIKYNL
ncbi:TonB-dependent receptor [Ochrovirga pacifica]|uniref:TonB-dependent receptor n=1 Tax=Ochrovirga pacifica TaxID=1042376 RepID=UPI0002558364|nr:TonB-dependent receptor [Ochrovirga pacifica]